MAPIPLGHNALLGADVSAELLPHRALQPLAKLYGRVAYALKHALAGDSYTIHLYQPLGRAPYAGGVDDGDCHLGARNSIQGPHSLHYARKASYSYATDNLRAAARLGTHLRRRVYARGYDATVVGLLDGGGSSGDKSRREGHNALVLQRC